MKKPSFIIVLDNAHMMDAASWELYEAVRDGCHRVAMILLLQTDYNDEVKVHPSCKDTFEKVWQSPFMEANRVIELPRLTNKSLEQMLLFNASKYRESFMNEVEKMTQIVDPKQAIKNERDEKKWR